MTNAKGQQPQVDHPPRPASGSELYKLVMAFRRKGHTASFGMDVDERVKQR